MADKKSKFASRFSSALAQEEAARKKAEKEKAETEKRNKELQASATKARKDLLSQLEGIGKDIGALDVKTQKSGAVSLGFRDNKLVFAPDGEYDRISVSYEASPGDEHLFRAEDDEGQILWILSRGNLAAPLFDAGLDDLFVRGLGLPAPDDYVPLEVAYAAPPEPEPEPEVYFDDEVLADDDDDDDGELDSDEPKDVRDVLKERRREAWVNRADHTRVEGNTHAPWNIRPSNPGIKKKKKTAQDPNRVKPGEATADYDIRPTRTKSTNPRRKRKFAVDSGVGSAVKHYKPIIG